MGKRKEEIQIRVGGYDWFYQIGCTFTSVRLAPRFDKAGYYGFVMPTPDDADIRKAIEAAIRAKCAGDWSGQLILEVAHEQTIISS